jgi:hypothetical protein
MFLQGVGLLELGLGLKSGSGLELGLELRLIKSVAITHPNRFNNPKISQTMPRRGFPQNTSRIPEG